MVTEPDPKGARIVHLSATTASIGEGRLAAPAGQKQATVLPAWCGAEVLAGLPPNDYSELPLRLAEKET